jgi:hypothetical protein
MDELLRLSVILGRVHKTIYRYVRLITHGNSHQYVTVVPLG